MKEKDIIQAVDEILEDRELKRSIGVSKHDKQNLIRRRSLPMMLELLYKAGRLKLIDGSTEQQK